MIPPTPITSPAPLDYFCTDMEALSALATISNGSPPPLNVLDSIHPFLCQPRYLPEYVWYYVKRNGNVDMSSGFWKPKGGDFKLASDFPFTGFKTSYEFYEGQAPDVHKTAWIMLEYWIAPSDVPGSSKGKETSSLCKVFIRDAQFQNICLNHQLVGLCPDGSNNTANGSTSKSKMNEEDKMVELTVAGKHLDHHLEEILSEINSLSRGDYIQFSDLDNPVSPSSSSENSSCPSMSSDEYFDWNALLEDIDHDNNLDMVQRDAPCISSCAPSTLMKEVVDQGDSESLVSVRRSQSLDEENLKPNSPVPGSGYREPELKGEASSSSHNNMVSNGEGTAVDGGKKKKKKSVSKMKKIQKMYFCFFF